MSRDDDLPEWFSESSNSADDRGEPCHLEAVAGGPESDCDWFDQVEATPSAGETPPARDSGRKRTKLLFGGTVAAVLLAIGGGAWMLSSLLSGSETSASPTLTLPTTATTAPPSVEPVVADSECESSDSATTVTGNGKGDRESAAGVVLAFQHAYYVARDADAIKPLLAKDSPITNLDALQEGIDSVARGTTHCLHIERDGDDAVVELTETAPDGSATTYYQRVTTTRENGEVRIVSIEENSEGASE
ncbi:MULTISPECIES: hypothetical protein [unclassified Dietzia]|uniref:hypothetical protein n=1 Tax=unclassified Dietzia TaxID=2617939 RepID=UPI00117788DF|nr:MULTISPECIES: hypothetical protein [unclassified Dietzia]MDV3357251.1 hypothetical protein [Dietzia sp. IN118]